MVLIGIIILVALWIIGWGIFIFGNLIVSALKRNFEAALFLVPLFFNLVGFVEPIVTSAISEEGRHVPFSAHD